MKKEKFPCPKCGTSEVEAFCGHCGFGIYPAFENRLIAYFFDLAVFGIFCLSVENVILDLNGSVHGFFNTVFFIIYFVAFIRVWGQTPGKMLTQIKVVCTDGSPARWSNAFLRYVPEWVFVLFFVLDATLQGSFITFFLLFLSLIFYGFCDTLICLKTRDYRAIHNYIAGTVVVNDPKSK